MHQREVRALFHVESQTQTGRHSTSVIYLLLKRGALQIHLHASSVVPGVVVLTVYRKRCFLLKESGCWSETQRGAMEVTENRPLKSDSTESQDRMTCQTHTEGNEQTAYTRQ